MFISMDVNQIVSQCSLHDIKQLQYLLENRLNNIKICADTHPPMDGEGMVQYVKRMRQSDCSDSLVFWKAVYEMYHEAKVKV